MKCSQAKNYNVEESKYDIEGWVRVSIAQESPIRKNAAGGRSAHA